MRHIGLGIIIPMYNEEIVASHCIESVMSDIKKIADNLILIIVDDGSTDGTKTILREKKKKFGSCVELVFHKKNLGYGKALVSGIKKAKNLKLDYVLFMDSDLTNSPKDIKRFLKVLKNTGVDCIKATRYSLGGKMTDVPFWRQLISRVGNLVACRFFALGLDDCTNGFRLVKREFLDGIHFKENGFAIILEELLELKRQHADFTQLPVVLCSRQGKSSSFSYNLNTFVSYGKYALKAAFL